MGCKYQNETETGNSLLTLDEEQASRYIATLLPRTQQCWGVKASAKAHTLQ